jgi:hypothetical protein
VKHPPVLVGDVFGLLTVTAKSERQYPANGNRYVWTTCECGTAKEVQVYSLKIGAAMSCGCRQGFYTHGLSLVPEYKVWSAMKARCNDPNFRQFADYGGRGIKVCKRWLKFENFYNDMGPRPGEKFEIDRRKNNLGYSKANCAWVTQQQNRENTRKVLRVRVKGQTLSLRRAAREAGVAYETARYRYHRGFPVSKILEVRL